MNPIVEKIAIAATGTLVAMIGVKVVGATTKAIVNALSKNEEAEQNLENIAAAKAHVAQAFPEGTAPTEAKVTLVPTPSV